ncbi:MAG: hypothetical protein K2P09_09515 [Erysipelotrichales bacterium]|nr:hypothetical protein [Erysipelotrichales bacterium]
MMKLTLFINLPKYDVEVSLNNDVLTLDNIHLCQGANAVSIMTTRTIGFDNKL